MRGDMIIITSDFDKFDCYLANQNINDHITSCLLYSTEISKVRKKQTLCDRIQIITVMWAVAFNTQLHYECNSVATFFFVTRDPRDPSTFFFHHVLFNFIQLSSLVTYPSTYILSLFSIWWFVNIDRKNCHHFGFELIIWISLYYAVCSVILATQSQSYILSSFW